MEPGRRLRNPRLAQRTDFLGLLPADRDVAFHPARKGSEHREAFHGAALSVLAGDFLHDVHIHALSIYDLRGLPFVIRRGAGVSRVAVVPPLATDWRLPRGTLDWSYPMKRTCLLLLTVFAASALAFAPSFGRDKDQ